MHCPTPDGDPRTLPSVTIEIVLEEPADPPWADDMVAVLEDIMAIGPKKRNQIALRITCAWDAESEAFEPTWQFLDAAGTPLTGKAQRATNLSGFFGYLPLFWLGALGMRPMNFRRARDVGGACCVRYGCPMSSKQK